MFRLLKLLPYLREINLSSEDTLALIQRLETDSCRPEDYEVLIRVVRAHSKLSADDLEAFGALAGPSAARRRPSQGPGAKRCAAAHQVEGGLRGATRGRFRLPRPMARRTRSGTTAGERPGESARAGYLERVGR